MELVAPCAVVAFDMTVELGGSWRAFEEVDAAVAAFALEVGPELGAAIDLDGQTGKGRLAWSLSRKRLALCALARRQAWRMSTWRGERRR